MFAKEVLERMGFKVTQTAAETVTMVQVPPIGQLKAIEEVDMGIVTDAFLTATVIASVASGKTRTLGIANQRAKERHRIRAIIDQLDKNELVGKRIPELKRGFRVHCLELT
ncbi:hypothetical protein EST38_g14259 [Candolleomyces aberdarensis]|uniref:Enolpyruvate transferase domain-containing protein n=1 Tax=Candolleomyces aberdarensis TaxID=2316362 RepID=A0A4Q2CZK0_9AGAR|nr:hypothetical protein EST38_g14259 [Candolleomyces aberdarensis]